MKAAAIRNTAVIIQFSNAAIAFLLYICDVTVMCQACSSLFRLASYRGIIGRYCVVSTGIMFYGSTASFNQHFMCYLKRTTGSI